MNETKKLNEELDEESILEIHYLGSFSTMAKINKQIELASEDDGDSIKFAHFHFKHVHFKFMKECPQTKEDIIKMVAFPKTQLQKLSTKDIEELLTLLHSKWDKNSSMSVYQASIAVWGTLNDREIDYI